MSITAAKRKHIESLDENEFYAWRAETFVLYASCKNSNGQVKLGNDGFGKSIVKYRLFEGEATAVFKKSNEAMTFYKKIAIE